MRFPHCMSYDNTNHPDRLQGNAAVHRLYTAKQGRRGCGRGEAAGAPSRVSPAQPGALGHRGGAGVSLPGLQGLWGSAQEMKPIYDQTSAHLCHYGKVINIREGKDIADSI